MWAVNLPMKICVLFKLFASLTPLCSGSHSTTLEFEFLSNIENDSRLHQNDFHVINLKSQSNDDEYVIHLKKSDIFHPEHLGFNENEVDELQCFYSGPVISHKDNKKVGLASLSSCSHHHAFEGFLMVNNQHFEVEPATGNDLHPYSRITRSTRNQRDGTGPARTAVRHKLTSPGKVTSPGSFKRRKDSKRVPPAELRKAREQMQKDQESLEDEDEEEEDDDDNLKDDDLKQQLSLNGYDQGEDGLESMLDIENEFAVRRRKPKIVKKKAKVIELAVFTDKAFYKKFSSKLSDEEAEQKIRQFVLAAVNNMNYLYHQPSLRPKPSFRLVHLEIQKSTPSGLDRSTSGEKYLDSFCEYAGKKDTKGALWDHAMMFTSNDLKGDGSGDVIGIASVGAMCLRYYSCSLIEYTKGFETMYTAAHELGHSLGLEHDGEEQNTKCNPLKFIMAAGAGPGQVNWSSCSKKNLQNFINTGDSRRDKKDPRSIPKCLTKRGSKRSRIPYQNGFPGQKYNLENQCGAACSGCTPLITGEKPFNKICKMVYCQGPKGDVYPMHPALEGTTCGTQKRGKCRNGTCK